MFLLLEKLLKNLTPLRPWKKEESSRFIGNAKVGAVPHGSSTDCLQVGTAKQLGSSSQLP